MQGHGGETLEKLADFGSFSESKVRIRIFSFLAWPFVDTFEMPYPGGSKSKLGISFQS